jgi:uncharacterized protein YqhQ
MKLPPKKDKESSLAFGGQAVIEGIMIRSRNHTVICVRQPNNEILTETETITPVSERHIALSLPFLRGVITLFETLYLGVKGIYFSANAVLEEEQKFTYKEAAITVFMFLALASFFFVVPFILTSLLNLTGVVFNLVEALVRLSFFITYLVLISMWNEFRRVLQYHGAEHKVINAQEAGTTLNISNAKKFSVLHPRCGTSFLFILMLVSVLLLSIMPNLGFSARLSYRLLLIPVIGAVSYEILRFSDRHKDSRIMRVLVTPGLIFQRLTTREPDDEMIEVALKAVEETNRLEQGL